MVRGEQVPNRGGFPRLAAHPARMVRRPSRLAPLALPPVQVSVRDELIAMDVFRRAEDVGQRVTLAMVEAHLPAALAAELPLPVPLHPRRRGPAARVYELVRRWQWSTAAAPATDCGKKLAPHPRKPLRL